MNKIKHTMYILLLATLIFAINGCYLAGWGDFFSIKNVSPARIHDLRGISIVAKDPEILWPAQQRNDEEFIQSIEVTFADPRGGKVSVDIIMCPVFGEVSENPLVLLGAQSTFYELYSQCKNRDYSIYSSRAQNFFKSQGGVFDLDLINYADNSLGLSITTASFTWNKYVTEVMLDLSLRENSDLYNFKDTTMYVFAAVSKIDSEDSEIEVMALPLKVLPNVYNESMSEEIRRKILSDKYRMCSRNDYNTCELRYFRYQDVPPNCGDGLIQSDEGEECDPPNSVVNNATFGFCAYDCRIVDFAQCPPTTTCIEPDRLNKNPIITGYDFKVLNDPKQNNIFGAVDNSEQNANEDEYPGEFNYNLVQMREGDDPMFDIGIPIKVKPGQLFAFRGVYSPESTQLYQLNSFFGDGEIPDVPGDFPDIENDEAGEAIGDDILAKELIVAEEFITGTLYIGSNEGVLYNIFGDNMDIERSALEPPVESVEGSMIYQTSSTHKAGDKESIILRIYDSRGGIDVKIVQIIYE